MCGIAGIILKQRTSLNAVDVAFKMSQAIKHRGPDGEGIIAISDTKVQPFLTNDSPKFKNHSAPYIPSEPSRTIENCNAAFAHRRLSIIDLSELGHQPMCNNSGEIWITYNGELYNYLELKKELIQLGYTFVSETDTEVVINAYKHWGFECVQKFNGMWSFCIHDSVKQLAFASRDRFGVKPFYYINNVNYFAFASEQKAFIKSGLLKAEMHPEAIHSYLINEEIENETANFFEGITELWPGSNLIFDHKSNSFDIRTYYVIEDQLTNSNDNLSDEQLTELIKESLYNAIQLRLRSDVEVGTCLSGGIDSSVIASIMSSIHQKPIHCFTSVFRSGAANEERFADLVSAKIKAKHFKTEPTVAEFEKDLDQLIYALDAPIWDTSTYAQFRVMALARSQNIKVVLDGQGADELFAGYHHHFLAHWNQTITEKGMLTGYSEIMQGSKSIAHPLQFYFKQKLKQNFPQLTQKHLSLLNSDFVASASIKNNNITEGTVNKQLMADMGSKRLKSFLRCEDRCGMWHSVESRTPFSDDIKLIELLFSFNGNRKIKNGVSKFYLREACKDVLPDQIYNRYDKVGFETPMNSWLKNLEPKIFESISQANFDFVNIDQVRKQYNPSKSVHVKLLFKLFVLSKWQSVFKG